MPFHIVRATNQYGYYTYKVGQVDIDEKRGGSCVIAWPDDHEEVALFYPVKYTIVSYGHGCGVGGETGTGYRPTFPTEIHGLKVEVPLENVRVDPATISQEDE